MSLYLAAGIPDSSKLSRALAECSRSVSIEVSTASFGAP